MQEVLHVEVIDVTLCGHCNRFAPAYELVAERLHSQNKINDKKIKVAKIDGASDRALASRFNIKAFPSFFLIDGWTVYEFNGVRSLEDLVDFATEGYKKQEPIPFLHSPFGPMGQLRASFMYCGGKVLDIFNYLVEKGISEKISAMILASVGILIGICVIIILGLLTLPKQKNE